VGDWTSFLSRTLKVSGLYASGSWLSFEPEPVFWESAMTGFVSDDVSSQFDMMG